MKDEEKQPQNNVGEMHKRRETMPDGNRYIIYYTFGDEKSGETIESPAANSGAGEVKENV